MRAEWYDEESGEWFHTISNNWIYIGADIYQRDYSKIGKTTVGPNIRHTSSQGPGFYIYTAYNIMNGDVSIIEKAILNYLDSMLPHPRASHVSTGSISECFWVNPYHVVGLVEHFIETNYPSSVTYESVQCGAMSRYQCPDNIYNRYNPRFNYIWPTDRSSIDVPNLNMSASQYFTGNQVEYETCLEDVDGGSIFLDHDTGMEMYRDSDGNVY
ncbi:hypothetical protein [Psychrobacter sp. UBA3480]|uniref:hypothetical protein n=1 Tax=Psychrobacter sp. UBA3480 TaxID=1947350 RepID=UPI0025FA4C48|nr:hypothetical protein [Psychrobacter sp. UBA3480]